uniref:Uncharacterized protein n=1 Tax=Cacopsylla melanoneura TaxID=428564 RepID=A0A8D8VD43_9HEMI
MSSIILACTQLTVVLLISCLVSCVEGSCLRNYGHSCMGAHGKRSGSQTDGQWFISKLDNSWRGAKRLPYQMEAPRHDNIPLDEALNVLSNTDPDYNEEEEDNPSPGLMEEGGVRGVPMSGNGEEPVYLMKSKRLYKQLPNGRKMDFSKFSN